MLRKNRPRGTALAAVFMVIGIALVVAFTLAGTSVFQLHIAASSVSRSEAVDLAESAVSIAIAEVMEDQNQQAPISPTLTVSTSTSNTLSYLTFVPGNSMKLPWSVNNLTGTSSVTGPLPGEVVAPTCVALVGTGQAGGIQAQVEAIIHFPAYPYVVASSGPFNSPHGGVTVAESGGLAPACGGLVPLCHCIPGDLLSNSYANPAIYLGPNSKVTGCVEAPGRIVLAPGLGCGAAAAKVLGSIDIINPVQLPCVPITDPSLPYAGVALIGPCGAGCPSSGAHVFCPGSCHNACNPCGCLPANSTIITGMARALQCVTFPADLQLDGAILFVNGNLTVKGKLRGMGAILGTGTMTFSGGSALTAENMIAILAGSSVTMNGPVCDSSIFNGLVYTKGNLTAANLKLYGNFVANAGGASAGCGGAVTMCNVNLVASNSIVGITLVSPGLLTGSSSSSSCPRTCICLVSIPSGNAFGYACCKAFMPKGASTGTTCPKCIQHYGIHKCTLGGGGASYIVCVPCPKCSSKRLSKTFCGQCAKKNAAKFLVCVAGAGKCGKYCCSMKKQDAKIIACCFIGCCCCTGPPPPPIARGPFVRVKCTKCVVPGTVFNFNFNQFIQPADQTRLILWRQL